MSQMQMAMVRRCFSPSQWFDEDGVGEDLIESAVMEICHPQTDLSAALVEGKKIMWVYRNQGQIFEVGFWSPTREWHRDGVYDSKDEAAARVHWLNGGN